MNRRLLTIIFIMLLWASATQLQADDTAFTVLSPTQVVHLDRLCSRDGPGPVSEGWQPRSEHVAQAEARLPSFVRANRKPKEPLGDHYRQYLGVVIAKRRLIYVNVFPRRLIERRELAAIAPNDWRTRFVDMCDGGDGFWGALYDPETLQFFAPRFNGAA